MLFVVMFDDVPAAFGIRQREMPAHLAFLQAHAAQIRVAGSLRESPAFKPMGACWIVEADSRDDVEALIALDPFFIHGLRADHRVLHWSKAFDTPVLV